MPSQPAKFALLGGAATATILAVLLTTFRGSAGETPGVRRVNIADPCGRIVVDDKGDPVTIEIDEDADPELTPPPDADRVANAVPEQPEEKVPMVMVPASPGGVPGAVVNC